MSRPYVCAHRGASWTLPDNSLEAFEAAIASGCEAIETDLRRGPDERIVLAHDAADAHRPGVVELEALLELADERIFLDLEVKEAGFERELLELLGPRRPLVSSFSAAVVRRLRELSRSIDTGLLFEPPLTADPVRLAEATDAGAVMVEESLLSADLLEGAAAAGHPVWVWTVNDEARLREMLAEPMISAVITDRPELAVAIRESLGGAA